MESKLTSLQKTFINSDSPPGETRFTFPNGTKEDQDFLSNLSTHERKLVTEAMTREENQGKSAQAVSVALANEGQEYSYEGKPSSQGN